LLGYGSVYATIDIGAIGALLPGSPQNEHQSSDVSMYTMPDSGTPLMIIGTMAPGKSADEVMAIETNQCIGGSPPYSCGALYWYFSPYSDMAGQVCISVDQYGNSIIEFTDHSYGTYFIGPCGGSRQEPCLFPE